MFRFAFPVPAAPGRGWSATACVDDLRSWLCPHGRIHAHARSRTHTRTHTRTHAHTRTRTHTRTHRPTHRHTHRHRRTRTRTHACPVVMHRARRHAASCVMPCVARRPPAMLRARSACHGAAACRHAPAGAVIHRGEVDVGGADHARRRRRGVAARAAPADGGSVRVRVAAIHSLLVISTTHSLMIENICSV